MRKSTKMCLLIIQDILRLRYIIIFQIGDFNNDTTISIMKQHDNNCS
jgi:hypothetical protein